MTALKTTGLRAAPSDAPILIQGPSGTGKELLATLIHQASGRAAMPFFPVNCGALHEHLLASELFGHERDAFTGATGRKHGLFEVADGGTPKTLYNKLQVYRKADGRERITERDQ